MIMQEMPLVSIIIPTYNDGLVVCQAIDCSLNQTYKNREVIVVDDGSTDATEQLLKERYQDKIVYVRQENRGPGAARNRGVRNASGKYVQFLDADDLIDRDKIRMQIDLLKGVPGRALSYCDYVYCDMDDITVIHKDRYLSPVLQKEKPYYDIMMKWETELSIPMHCFLFDVALFKENGIAFDERLPSNEDWDCWMDIFALQPHVVYIDKVLAYYRIRRGSRCSNRLKMRKGYLWAIDKQIRKNREQRDLVGKLSIRRKQIKYRYRDVSPLMRLLGLFPPIVKQLYLEKVRWGIQRLFD